MSPQVVLKLSLILEDREVALLVFQLLAQDPPIVASYVYWLVQREKCP